jgi:UDP-GlcNAc:undecaprenyl-phosphate GlcNAc-1-phosphate transferase
MNLIELLGFFGFAFLTSVLAIRFLVKKELKVGMDIPIERRKVHVKVVPRLGGGAIFLCFIYSIFVVWWIKGKDAIVYIPFILFNIGLFSTGFVDDFKALGAKYKLCFQLICAGLAWWMGLRINHLDLPFAEKVILLEGAVSFVVTVFWLISIPNIINLIDGMDGLAGGVSLFICLTMGYINWEGGNWVLMLFVLWVSGGILGFLAYNFPPAKIYLGDGGAYFLGAFIASFAIEFSQKESVAVSLSVVFMALGIPILDTLFAILRRAFRGLPVFKADAEHIHHRLMVLGYSKSGALVVLYVITVGLCLLGIGMIGKSGHYKLSVLTFLVILFLVTARYLGYVRSWTLLKGQIQKAMVRRERMLWVKSHCRAIVNDIYGVEDLRLVEKHLEMSLEILGYETLKEEGLKNIVKIKNGDLLVVEKIMNVSEEDQMNHLDEFQIVVESMIEKWGEIHSGRYYQVISKAQPKEHG